MIAMGKYQYRYKGHVTVHLPLHGITAKGGDEKTTYETDEPIKHPDFEELKEHAKEEQTKKSTK